MTGHLQCLDHHDLLISGVALWQVTFSVLITMTSLYLVLLCYRSPSVSWSPWPPYIWCCFVTGHLQCLDHHDLLISDVALWQVTFSVLITMTSLYLMLLCDRSPSALSPFLFHWTSQQWSGMYWSAMCLVWLCWPRVLECVGSWVGLPAPTRASVRTTTWQQSSSDYSITVSARMVAQRLRGCYNSVSSCNTWLLYLVVWHMKY